MLKSFITKFLYNWFPNKYSLYMFVLESLGFSGIYINLLLFFKYTQQKGEFFSIHCCTIYLLYYSDSLKWFKVYIIFFAKLWKTLLFWFLSFLPYSYSND